jgi:hypothetical protein
MSEPQPLLGRPFVIGQLESVVAALRSGNDFNRDGAARIVQEVIEFLSHEEQG